MMKRAGEAPPVALLPRPATSTAPALRRAQNACYEALSLALKEGHVFAALTGPEGCGKTTVLEAVLADRQNRALRCIRINDPDKVPASLAAQIEQTAYAEASKPENLERHVVLAVDDAQTASDELLICLSRIAEMREPGRRVPQVLLVGRPELWNRLAADEYDGLARRLAIRAALPAAEDDADPWAFLESEVAQTMNQLRAEAEQMPAVQEHAEPVFERELHFEPAFGFGPHEGEHAEASPDQLHEHEIPPPSMYALFPDPPPKARSAARETRRRLVMPLVSLFVGLAAFAFALSFYDWPDLFDQMPWSDPKPSAPFVMPPRSLQAPSFGLPQPPRPAASTPAAAPKPVAALPNPTPAAEPPPPAPVRQAIVAPAEKPAAPLVAETPARPEPTVEAAPVRPAPPPVAAPAPVVTQAAPPPVTAIAPLPTPPVPPPASVARAPAVAEPPLAPAVVALLLRRGDEQNSIGDISAARLLYERAAEAGSGLAARQLARTYDPAFLTTAVEPALADPAKARQWYQRAAALGNSEAAARLRALNQGR